MHSRAETDKSERHTTSKKCHRCVDPTFERRPGTKTTTTTTTERPRPDTKANIRTHPTSRSGCGSPCFGCSLPRTGGCRTWNRRRPALFVRESNGARQKQKNNEFGVNEDCRTGSKTQRGRSNTTRRARVRAHRRQGRQRGKGGK